MCGDTSGKATHDFGAAISIERTWLMLSKNDRFEKNIRKNLGPYLRSDLEEYDKYAKHRPRSLKRMIQPSLKKLGYYTARQVWMKKKLF